MSYNTSRGKMIIPEYGRNIQKMVDFACTVEEKDERNKVAKAIIKVMGQLNPVLRDEEYAHKLWAHLFIMSDFKLDIESPYPIPTAESFASKPERVAYPQSKMRYNHYGKAIPKMIEKCRQLEDKEEQKALKIVIANMMKKSYLMWNRDSVNDELIAGQLKEMSKGELELEDLTVLLSTQEILKDQPKNNRSNKNNSNNRRRNQKRKKRY